MAKFSTFAKDIQLATAGLAPDRIAAELARFAKSERDQHIARGEASPVYDTFVNGVKDAREESVTAPGPILYVFAYWQPVINFAMERLKRRGPRLSGAYEDSHTVMVGGQEIAPNLIGADEEVTLVATVPYARKIEVGHMRMAVERGIYQDVAHDVQRQFGGTTGFSVEYRQVYIPNGYILKGVFRAGFRKHRRTGLKRDTQAGARMSYPALVMSMRA